jgi:hypothetical protein
MSILAGRKTLPASFLYWHGFHKLHTSEVTQGIYVPTTPCYQEKIQAVTDLPQLAEFVLHFQKSLGERGEICPLVD